MSSPKRTMTSGSELAKLFHETYERLAPSFGYVTRIDTAKPWEEIPDCANKRLMEATCAEILTDYEAKCADYERLRDALEIALIPLAALVVSGACVAAQTELSETVKVAVLVAHDAVLKALGPATGRYSEGKKE